MKKYFNENYGWELKESLQETAERLEVLGFTIEVWNCGNLVVAYLSEYMKYEDYCGRPAKNGCMIQVEETFRHNGTERNVNIDMRVYKHERSIGILQGKDEKKIRFRMDASEKVKNSRIEAIVERYNRFK